MTSAPLEALPAQPGLPQRPDLPTSLHLSTARIWRGAENQVLHTIRGLRQLGARAVLAAHEDGELLRRLAGADVVALSPRGEWDVLAAWRLARLIRRLRPDIVHVHEPHGVSIASLAKLLVGRTTAPMLVASRRVATAISPNRLSGWKYARVDGFLAISQAVRGRLISDGIPPEQVSVVHSGTDVEAIAATKPADMRRLFNVPSDALVVGSVGALAPEKGHQHLIDAAALVVREIPRAWFVICGEGKLRQQLQEQIDRLGVHDHVVLAGFRTDVHALLRSFDLFALSSLEEGLCSSLIDAMAASRVAVATRVGGVPEVVVDGETGFLVAAADPAAMASRIVQLLKDEPLRRRMGEAGLAQVRERFTIAQMVRRTLTEYQKLLATRRQ